MNKTNLIGLALVATCGMAYAGPVYDISPGEFYDGLSGITSAEMSELRGSIVFDEYREFSIGGFEGEGAGPLYEGTFLTRLVRSNETGNLAFNFRFYNDNVDLDGQIKHIEITGFGSHETRVEYRAEAGPDFLDPISVSRDLSGDMLSFNFSEDGDEDASSKFFFAMLDTQEYDLNANTPQATIYLFSGESVTIDLAPPVPTPGSLALLGAAGLLASRRRR